MCFIGTRKVFLFSDWLPVWGLHKTDLVNMQLYLSVGISRGLMAVKAAGWEESMSSVTDAL